MTVKTIGTNSRDYATITLWEADLDDGLIYTAGEDVTGELYNDSDFDCPNITISTTIALGIVSLEAAPGHEHDGTFGSGVTLTRLTGSVFGEGVTNVNETPTRWELRNIIFDWDGVSQKSQVLKVGSKTTVDRCLFHASSDSDGVIKNSFDNGTRYYNNILVGDPGGGIGITVSRGYAINNTAYGMESHGINGTNNGSSYLRNNLCVGNGGNDFQSTSVGAFTTNFSSDATGNTTTASASDFVSTLGGFEDLHLASTAVGIGQGEDYVAAYGDAYEDYVAIDIDGNDRSARASWSVGADEPPATVTKSIGATGRDYSTIDLWHADLLDASVYIDGDTPIGECYADADFSVSGQITFTAAYAPIGCTLTAAETERHAGIRDTGVYINCDGNTSSFWAVHLGIHSTSVTWLHFDLGASTGAYSHKGFNFGYQTAFSCVVSHNIVTCQDTYTGNGPVGAYVNANKTGNKLQNNVFIDMDKGAQTTYSGTFAIANNTFLSQPDDYAGIQLINSSANCSVQNNLIAGFANCIFNGPYSTQTNNATTDATGEVTSVVAADEMVSTATGFEDTHLKTSSSLIGSGVDLGADFAIDIDGEDRSARTNWSIGADEPPATVTKSIGTTGRDYSTVELWVADKADTSIYLFGDNAVGECYADSIFTKTGQTQISVGSLLGTIHLTAAVGERHDGTFGTGVQFTQNAADYLFGVNTNGIVSWLSVEQDSTVGGQFESKTATEANRPIIRNCMLQGTGTNRKMVNATNTCVSVENTVLCDSQNNAIYASGFPSRIQIINCTGYNNGTYQSRGGFGEAQNARVNTWNSISFANGDDFKNIDPAGNLSDTFENCISGDASSSTGTNNVQNAVATDLFVSTTGGFYDFHLLPTASDAIGQGQDLGADYAIDIDGDDRGTGGRAWDIGADQRPGVIVSSIGTNSRDYSTITLWHADLANFIVGDDATGEMYADSTFSEDVNATDNASGIVGHIHLTAAVSERHDGTAGTGPVLTPTISSTTNVLTIVGDGINEVSWFEIDGLEQEGIGILLRLDGSARGHHMILHSRHSQSTSYQGLYCSGSSGALNGPNGNNIVYNLKRTDGTYGAMGIYVAGNSFHGQLYNCTVHNIKGPDSRPNDGTGIRFQSNNSASKILRNCLVTDCPEYTIADQPLNTQTNNATDDGLGGVTPVAVTAADYVSSVVGFEDLHITAGSNAIGAGFDVKAGDKDYGDMVNLDIDGEDRTGETWDIGADQTFGATPTNLLYNSTTYIIGLQQ